jgi:hypothetical protein
LNPVKLGIPRIWIVGALGVLVAAAVAVTAVVLLSGGSKAASTQDLVQKVATAGNAGERSDAARELATKLDAAAVTGLARLASTSSRARTGLVVLRRDLIGLYDEPGASIEQRRKALLCLGRVGDQTAGAAVVDALVSAPSPAVRDAAATALTGATLSPAVAERLVTARQDATDPASQKRLERVIVTVGKPVVLALVYVIRDEQAPEDSWAAKLIGRIGLPALPLLRNTFASNQLNRAAAAVGLLELRKRYPAQIRPLVPGIMTKMMGRLGAPMPVETEIHVLAMIGKPAVAQLMALRRKDYGSLPPAQQKIWSNADYALSDIAKVNPAAASELLGALSRKDYSLIAEFHMVFIMLGKPGSETVLIGALNSSGDSLMALDFLNSGNRQLTQAAESWASSHGYTVTYGSGTAPSNWGSAGG